MLKPFVKIFREFVLVMGTTVFITAWYLPYLTSKHSKEIKGINFDMDILFESQDIINYLKPVKLSIQTSTIRKKLQGIANKDFSEATVDGSIGFAALPDTPKVRKGLETLKNLLKKTPPAGSSLKSRSGLIRFTNTIDFPYPLNFDDVYEKSIYKKAILVPFVEGELLQQKLSDHFKHIILYEGKSGKIDSNLPRDDKLAMFVISLFLTSIGAFFYSAWQYKFKSASPSRIQLYCFSVLLFGTCIFLQYTEAPDALSDLALIGAQIVSGTTLGALFLDS